MIIAIVGAGGKTTLVKKLADQYKEQGKCVFITTSTHMMIENDTLLTDDPKIIIEALKDRKCVMAGQKMGEKIGPLSPETYKEVCEYADIVLIEADGSRHMPLKYPRADEPVIYDNVDEIIIVCGLHALGGQMKDTVQRLELAKTRLHLTEEIKVQAEHIELLVKEGYVKPLREKYPDKNVRIEPNADGSLYQRAVASLLKDEEPVTAISETWFLSQPQLIVCGAGHVATELVKMAAHLDFYIKVIDDREEFANAERLPMADEVICDSFEELETYMSNQAYYVVLTRGHKSDFDCVNKIMRSSYQYLGMIGSRRKVKSTIEKLQAEGYGEEKIQTLHAPIGLAIGAQTPAEIAVSILAEIIQEKNQIDASYASRELLSITEKGTLCIIVEKKGSAPRGIGSMMFVGEDCVIDTIGGGAIEKEVIEEARKIKKITRKEYYLSNEEGADLGMICGGSNTILFIPV